MTETMPPAPAKSAAISPNPGQRPTSLLTSRLIKTERQRPSLRLRPNTMIEVASQSHREQPAPIQRMLHARCQQRTCLSIAPRKEDATKESKHHRDRIAKNDVQKSKGRSTRNQQRPSSRR